MKGLYGEMWTGGPHAIKLKSLKSDPKEHPDLGINQENHLQEHREAAALLG